MNQELISQLNGIKVIETTYELVRPDFVYRITVGTDGVLIKRTRADEPMWTHGALTQAYDGKAACFVPMIKVDRIRLTSAEAEMVISSL